MQIVRDVGAIWPGLAMARGRGTIALVPTMGALHAGHMALVEAAQAARRPGRRVDLRQSAAVRRERGPRPLSAARGDDAAMLEQHGCDLLWMPTAGPALSAGFATTVSVAGVSERWEGEARPGHFDGVATVVAKLFTAVRPDVACSARRIFSSWR